MDVVGELFESETIACKLDTPLRHPPTHSFFDIPTSKDSPTSKFHLTNSFTNSSPLHTSLDYSYDNNSIFIEQPFGTRKRSYGWDDEEDDEPSPRHKAAKIHSSAPENSTSLFDDQPVGDFFGFSHSQDSFSDFSHKKLFSGNFLGV